MPHTSHTPCGTPTDYSADLYLIHFEVGEIEGTAKRLLSELLAPRHQDSLSEHPFGYRCALPIQMVPEAVRSLSEHNIAIYQVVRMEKLDGQW